MQKATIFLFLLISLSGCSDNQSKTARPAGDSIAPAAKPGVPVATFDTIIRELKTNGVLSKADLLELNIIDAFYVNQADGITYCDTTVQLSDSIFYSIIGVPDSLHVCSYFFIVTIDEKNKKAIASRYLEPACDVDYSWDSYELYEHNIVTKGSIRLTKTTVFQKKNRVSGDEEENIDHKETASSYFYISPAGRIELIEK